MPSSNRSLMAADPNSSQQMDPILQQEIATKKQYIDKLRNQVRELNSENDMLMQTHYV